ncbi:hypothetical protein Tco_0223971 [Tanacetum coccineum]
MLTFGIQSVASQNRAIKNETRNVVGLRGSIGNVGVGEDADEISEGLWAAEEGPWALISDNAEDLIRKNHIRRILVVRILEGSPDFGFQPHLGGLQDFKAHPAETIHDVEVRNTSKCLCDSAVMSHGVQDSVHENQLTHTPSISFRSGLRCVTYGTVLKREASVTEKEGKPAFAKVYYQFIGPLKVIIEYHKEQSRGNRAGTYCESSSVHEAFVLSRH